MNGSLRKFRRRWHRIRRDELVEALRANVSDLHNRLNRTKRWGEAQVAKNRQLREQLALDRVYIDGLKAAIRHVIEDSPGTPDSVKDYLGKALHGVED